MQFDAKHETLKCSLTVRCFRFEGQFKVEFLVGVPDARVSDVGRIALVKMWHEFCHKPNTQTITPRWCEQHRYDQVKPTISLQLRIIQVSKQCIAVSNNLLALLLRENSHAIWDRTLLPATRQRRDSRLYPQPKQVLDLATLEGC